MQKFAKVVEHNDVQILVTAGFNDDAVPTIKMTWRSIDGAEMDFSLLQTDKSLSDDAKDAWLNDTLASQGVIEIAQKIADKVSGLDAMECVSVLRGE